MKKYSIFYLKIFTFLVVKFSVYLNRRVFVMCFFFEIIPMVLGPILALSSSTRRIIRLLIAAQLVLHKIFILKYIFYN